MINSPAGRVELIIGPMFSGKTTELFRRIRRYTVAGFKCIVIKWKNDNRYTAKPSDGTDEAAHKTEKLVSYNRDSMEANACLDLDEVRAIAEQYDVVAIDEGQFFSTLVSFCDTLANMGKDIIIAALDSTYRREPFGQVNELIPKAEKVTKLTAVCRSCKGEASFTRRFGGCTQTIVIGGAEMYEANCRRCWHRLSQKYPVEDVTKSAGACGVECSKGTTITTATEARSLPSVLA